MANLYKGKLILKNSYSKENMLFIEGQEEPLAYMLEENSYTYTFYKIKYSIFESESDCKKQINIIAQDNFNCALYAMYFLSNEPKIHIVTNNEHKNIDLVQKFTEHLWKYIVLEIEVDFEKYQSYKDWQFLEQAKNVINNFDELAFKLGLTRHKLLNELKNPTIFAAMDILDYKRVESDFESLRPCIKKIEPISPPTKNECRIVPIDPLPR